MGGVFVLESKWFTCMFDGEKPIKEIPNFEFVCILDMIVYLNV